MFFVFDYIHDSATMHNLSPANQRDGSFGLLNLIMGDQFLSIIMNASIYKEEYANRGYQPELLSRSTEDSATVTSVLVPWTACGMTQSTVLGVPTLVYLPFCFFNIISPIMSIIFALLGKIPKGDDNTAE